MTRTATPRSERRAARRSDPARAAARAARDARAERWQQRLALPVIIAAMVSVPAVFLTMLDSRPYQVAGYALNWASLVVLAGEAVLLFLLSGRRRAWLKRHMWPLLLTIVAVPAVIFAIAPVQALRLLALARAVGTLRILRAKTIISAGRILADKLGLTGPWRYAPVLGGSLLAAGFVALVLADPTAAREHERVLNEVSRWIGLTSVLIAGVILGAAAFIVVLYRRRVPRSEPDAEPSGEPDAEPSGDSTAGAGDPGEAERSGRLGRT